MRKGLIGLMLFGLMPLFGQTYDYRLPSSGIKPLTKEQGYPQNQLFLQIKENPDSFPLYRYLIYFINPTDKDVIVSSYNGRINPIFGSYHREGKWYFSESRGWCGTGYGKSIIPANHYAWTYRSQSKGSYETEVKLRLAVNDTVLFSPAFTTFVDEPNRFGKYGARIQNYEAALKEETDTAKKAIYLDQIGKMLMVLKRNEMALSKFETAILLDSTNYEARYWKGFLYLKDIPNCDSSKKHLTPGIISAALAEWNLIPEWAARHEAVQRKKAIYLPKLLTKEEWEVDNDLPFKLTEDGSKLYYIDCLVNDYIKITYKK